jgi:ATP synthase protein I
MILAICSAFLTGYGLDNMLRAACWGRLTSLRIRQTAFFEAVRLLLACQLRLAATVFATACRGKDAMTERDRSEEEDRLLRARLEKLSGDLQKKRKESPQRSSADDQGGSGNFGSAMGLGLRAASEFAAAIVVGGLIGWQLDAWLGTKPAFLIVFFMLGVAAGIWNVIRLTSAFSRVEPKTPDQPAPPNAEQSAPFGADEDED